MEVGAGIVPTVFHRLYYRMNESLLRELSEKIAREQFLFQWPIYALMVAIALVVGFGAAWIGTYAKKRGEALATKADFEQLLEQLKSTTAVAEEVKAQVSHLDWATREFKTLRRLKLEEALKAIYQLREWQHHEMCAQIFNSSNELGPSPLPIVELLYGLYFPELKPKVDGFCQIHRQMMIILGEGKQKLLAASNNAHVQKKIREEFSVDWNDLYKQQLVVISVIETDSKEIMNRLIGVAN